MGKECHNLPKFDRFQWFAVRILHLKRRTQKKVPSRRKGPRPRLPSQSRRVYDGVEVGSIHQSTAVYTGEAIVAALRVRQRHPRTNETAHLLAFTQCPPRVAARGTCYTERTLAYQCRTHPCSGWGENASAACHTMHPPCLASQERHETKQARTLHLPVGRWARRGLVSR